MIVTFADGFSSATPPNVTGQVQEKYILANNMSAFANLNGLIFDSTKIRSAFASFEISRQHDVATVETVHRETIEMTFIFDGTSWGYTYGLQSGVDMVHDDLGANDYDVSIGIDVTTGQVRYKTNSMTGDNYEGVLLASILRMVSI